MIQRKDLVSKMGLCLTCKTGESIFIMDGLVKVTVYRIESRKGTPSVMLHVDAPKEVPVDRERIYLIKKKEKEAEDASFTE